MPANQLERPVIEIGDDERTLGLVEYLPASSLTDLLAREHIPPFTEYIRTHTAPFHLLSYLHQFGQHLVRSLVAGYTHRHIYDFLAKQQTRPIPVSYSQFCRGMSVFRQEKGLPPCYSLASRRRPAVAEPAPLPTASSQAATASPVSSPPSPSAISNPGAPAPVVIVSGTLPAASAHPVPSSSAPCSDDVLSPEEQETRALQARAAKRFRPFTAEDAKYGKPAAEAIADQQRAELAAYERSLKDGTAID